MAGSGKELDLCRTSWLQSHFTERAQLFDTQRETLQERSGIFPLAHTTFLELVAQVRQLLKRSWVLEENPALNK